MINETEKMKSEIEINKISNFLKEILKDKSVSELYDWEIPFTKGHGASIFTNLSEFDKLENHFKKNVFLKTDIKKKIIKAFESADETSLKQIFEWLVHDWGGIRGGRNNIDKLFELGKKCFDNPKLNFERIASTSKILSFYKPEEYVIYDSRIAYSLNTIMFLLDASEKFFPIPSGTNSKMTAFNIDVLIRLKHKDKYKRSLENKKLISNADKNLFYKKDDSYEILNKTIIEINKEIFETDKDKIDKPYYTEMLLFSIADTIIYDLILERISVNIN